MGEVKIQLREPRRWARRDEPARERKFSAPKREGELGAENGKGERAYLVKLRVDSIVDEELSSVDQVTRGEGAVGVRLPLGVDLDVNMGRSAGVVSRKDG